ncbi:LysR family transcriptional regulator [Pseudonocardia petroleophila]|uniref:LysR family transcriptional regulator n=1 Tax=Pseudonocardia petroleophila TaxID=37331 RepID=A0A7G7MHS0_9PSEU|nr:LysR family transcriptional regulator [Pseudonocardia petroleophila]
MELRHLESFLVLADELHFGRAAARLHLAQPSLTQHLQRLERRVGVRLVDRGPHRVRLTDAGAAFRDEAQRVLERAEAAVRAAREVASGRAGDVAVGFNHPAGVRILPGVLARLAVEHPRLTARLSERRSAAQLAAVAAGEIDVALAFGPPADAALRSRVLDDVPVVAVVAPGHALAGRPAVAVAELAGHDCALFARAVSPALHDAVTGAAARAGVRLPVAVEVDDTAATGIVLAGRPLVGFASRERAVEVVARGLCAVPLVEPEPVVALHAAWRSDPGPRAATFLACLDQWTCERQSAGTRPAGPGAGWSVGWCSGGASSGPSAAVPVA